MKLVIDIPDEEYELDKWLAVSGMGSPAISRILGGIPYEERKGKWVSDGCMDICSECGASRENQLWDEYCGRCGVKMEVDE